MRQTERTARTPVGRLVEVLVPFDALGQRCADPRGAGSR